MSNARDIIIGLINNICDPDTPDLSDPNRALIGGDLDSLDYASLLMAVEDEFGIVIDESSVEKIGTLNGLIAYVESSI